MRKKRSLYNMLGSIGAYGVSLIFNFITQAIFIKVLGVEYLGVNGLFSNIITMLSLTELGVGTTILFKLYKPIAENDAEKIKSWMKFYRQCYNIVAALILAIGILLIPFLDIIVGEVAIQDNIILLYMIQIMDTVFSYCMTYKRSLLYADQKNYIINLVHIGYIIFMNITQIIVLYVTKNYVYYLLIKLIYRILENLLINIIVNKKYEFMKEKGRNISKEEKKDVLNRIKAIFIQKVSFVVNKGIDNIIISIGLGVAAVGYYTNYFTIISAVCSIIFQIMSSFSASIGDLLVQDTKEKAYSVYKKINMLNAFLTGSSIVLVSCLINPFITIWIGSEYILSNTILISFLFYLYCDSIRRTMTMYKDAAGICIEDRYMYLIMTIINLFLSIVLCNFVGMAGVIIGTGISYLFLIVCSYPKYVFKKLFNANMEQYYKENLKYACYILIGVLITYFICYILNIEKPAVQLVVNAVIGIFVSIVLFVIMFHKRKEYKDLVENMSVVIEKAKVLFK